MTPPISVTLASTAPHEVPRRIKLGGEPVVVGRASRNEQRGAAAKPDNALFECPVVSREHAELAVEKGEYGEDEVSLTDLKSMHGTFVNGTALEPGVPFWLQDGDMIQLGNSVARGSDTFKGVTVVFKKHDIDSREEGLSTRSTYSVPAESDVASECSDEFDEDLNEIDHDDDTYSAVEPDYYKYDSLDDEADALDEPLAEDHDVKQVGTGTQEKPIEVDSWPTGSLRHVMDLTRPAVRPVKLPAIEPVSAYPIHKSPSFSSTMPTVKSSDLKETIDESEKQPFANQTSVEHSSFPQPAMKIVEPPQPLQKPRYDPVREARPMQSLAPSQGTPEQFWPLSGPPPPMYPLSLPFPPGFPPPPPQMHLPAAPHVPAPPPPVTTEAMGISLDDLIRDLMPPSTNIKSKGSKSKKRKAENVVDCDTESVDACSDSLSQLSYRSPAKKVKLESPSRVQSIISDVRKYAFGAALGATGTFTFLASPLGGAFADWMSK